MLVAIHSIFAVSSLIIIVIATIEGGNRFIRATPWNNSSLRTLVATVVALSVTALAGIALVISGKHPKEWLHLLYVALAIGLIPFSDNAAIPLTSNRKKGLYRLAGGLTCLLVLTRLYVTGHR